MTPRNFPQALTTQKARYDLHRDNRKTKTEATNTTRYARAYQLCKTSHSDAEHNHKVSNKLTTD